MLLSASWSVYAQSYSIANDTLSWKVTKLFNLANQETVNLDSEFITQGPNSIKWLQENGGKVFEFSVVEMQGSWANLNEDGEVVYIVSLMGNDNKIKFQRVDGQLKISMEFIKDGENSMPYVFSVSKIKRG
jgi:hypothetical protein